MCLWLNIFHNTFLSNRQSTFIADRRQRLSKLFLLYESSGHPSFVGNLILRATACIFIDEITNDRGHFDHGEFSSKDRIEHVGYPFPTPVTLNPNTTNGDYCRSLSTFHRRKFDAKRGPF